ncbi:hypothetical protein ACFLSA_01135 [Bacteroidota bacterium]
MEIFDSTPLVIISKLIHEGKEIIFHAKGLSMFPILRENVTIRIVPTGIQKVKINDIVLFVQNHKLLAHRVLKIMNESAEIILICKGDTSFKKDLPVKKKDYIGIVNKYSREGNFKSLTAPGKRLWGLAIVNTGNCWAYIFKYLIRKPENLYKRLIIKD